MQLYVSNSDPAHPVVMEYEVQDDGGVKLPGSVFYDASPLVADAGSPSERGGGGNLDGMTVDIYGTVLVAGPGGLLVLSPGGVLLGRLMVGGERVATNVVFGDHGHLYITAGDTVLRTRISTRPAVKVAA